MPFRYDASKKRSDLYDIMKKLNNILLLICISVAFTACVDIYKGPESIYTQDIEVLLKPSVQGLEEEEILPEGMTAGLFVILPGKELSPQNTCPGLFNVKLELDSEGFLKSSPAVLYPEDGSKFDFILYSPRMDLNESASIDLSSPSEAADLLYSDNLRGKYKSLSTLKPVFRHAAAKLILNLSVGFGLTEAQLAASKITLANAATSGSFKLSDGSFVPGMERSALEIPHQGLKAESPVFPTDADGEHLTLVFAVEGNEFVAIIPDVEVFEYGKCYSFDVKVSVTGIVITPGEIKDWIANVEEGNAEVI